MQPALDAHLAWVRHSANQVTRFLLRYNGAEDWPALMAFFAGEKGTVFTLQQDGELYLCRGGKGYSIRPGDCFELMPVGRPGASNVLVYRENVIRQFWETSLMSMSMPSAAKYLEARDKFLRMDFYMYPFPSGEGGE